MTFRTTFAIAMMTAAVACTPREDVDVAAPAANSETTIADESAANGTIPDVTTGSSDGGALDVDRSVAVIYEVRTKSDIPAFVSSMMKLADKDTDGQLTLDEYDLLRPALAQEDNTLNLSAEGGPVANPGAAAGGAAASADPMRSETFFAQTAGANGTISSTELEAAFTDRFEIADANGDDTLDAAESKVFAASMLIDQN